MKNLLKKPFVKKLIIVFAAVNLFLLLMNFVIMPWLIYAEETSVPKVVGMPVDEAMRILESKNLQGIVGDTTFDARFPKGTIVLQKPFGGNVVKEGRKIYLVVSGGEQLITMPQLRGRSLRDAKFTLEKLGLRLGRVDEVYSNNPKDVIINQQFASGMKVKKGVSVFVTVSLGSEEGDILVPNVIGMALSEAEKVITAAGLRIGRINFRPSFTVLPNTVIDQFPVQNNKLYSGQTIDLFVTKITETTEEIKE